MIYIPPALELLLPMLEVVPLRRVAFQLSGEHVDVELDLERAQEEGQTSARLAVEGPRFGGLGRTFSSQALARLAALVRPRAE